MPRGCEDAAVKPPDQSPRQRARCTASSVCVCGGARKQATAAALRVRVHARARVCAGPCIQVPWRAVRFKGRGGGRKCLVAWKGCPSSLAFQGSLLTIWCHRPRDLKETRRGPCRRLGEAWPRPLEGSSVQRPETVALPLRSEHSRTVSAMQSRAGEDRREDTASGRGPGQAVQGGHGGGRCPSGPGEDSRWRCGQPGD